MPSLREVECPHCGHRHKVDLSQLTSFQTIYKDGLAVEEYRLRCPNCHQYFVITVEEERHGPGDDAP